MTLDGQLGSRVAVVFPGQGSQSVGMGKALFDSSPAARRIFEDADLILGFPLSRLCFGGQPAELDDTWNAQPAILTVSVAAWHALRERAAAPPISPLVFAGHSLGQFTALHLAGVLDFPTVLELVRERGRLMKEAGERRPGGMAAVIGLDDETLRSVCREAESEGIISIANANCPGQTVISGEVDALLKAMELARAAGARRVTRLGVTIASHSPLMAGVSARLNEILDGLPLAEPTVPVVGNVSGAPITTVADVRMELSQHLERPVNWTGSVETMIGLGATTFVEFGPGQVLSGLIRRINRDVTTLAGDKLISGEQGLPV
ncbi:MAG: ACP S-malonyltransferase [Chloroflexota bacterium]|nr:ACP S-malonyltransferase [Chloroflexota bacterium]